MIFVGRRNGKRPLGQCQP